MSYLDLITEENFGPYTKVHTSSLSKTQKEATPYADFYDYPINLPSEEQIRALMPNNQIDPARSIAPTEIKKMFAPGDMACENGYCIRPEGYGFSAVDIKMPEITPEMWDFGAEWSHSNPVHYNIWLPDIHITQFAMPGKHSSIEDLGWGNVSLDMEGFGEPLTLETLGIDNPKELDPDFLFFVGGNMTIREKESWYQKQPEPYPYMIMINYVRRCGTGIENRVRVWMGIQLSKGKIICEKCNYYIPLVDRLRGVACHNAWEWNRFATLIPAVYKFSKENHLLGL